MFQAEMTKAGNLVVIPPTTWAYPQTRNNTQELVSKHA